MTRDMAKDLASATSFIQELRRSLRTQPAWPTTVQNKIVPSLSEFFARVRRRAKPADDAAKWFRRGILAYQRRRYTKAFSAWKSAAAIGHAEAAYRIARLYARGEGVIPQQSRRRAMV